ncbi:hypothetical protein QYE76_019612 [Lolium multiflorum]|uniref:Uncharacterized protein n=1 Tax=Lolium multiflorum TaxID=4521 RepID=A0AAD8R4T7_LOLMU|nr:hypothetical protein QYE76_019612 [Lolium multiflorum]
MPSYNCWTKHGERGVIMEEDEEGDDFIDESYLAHFGDTFMEDAEGEGEGEEEARDDPVDDLGRTIDARRRCETEKERENLDRMLEDHRKALYPGCDDGLKKLGCTGFAEMEGTGRGDDPGDDVEGQKPRKKVPAKVMWYAPIIPRLKRLFRNKEHAKLLRWHKEDRKSDGELRHPADGTQWRKIDREFKYFAADARNIRFGLSTDGMNPFGEQSSSHSTWPVTLCIYNLPPWLCMKRKFIMMPVLIQGPKQPGNDIDVYLRPLVDELLQLWGRPGVRVWDEHKEEEFDLRALLFNVYLGHRRFLPKGHPVRKKGKHYNGKADHRPKPAEHTGAEAFDMVKDLKVIFGKGPGGQSVPKGADGDVAMWKKKSIFRELEYWKVLEVRSAIDVMHVTKNICVNILSFLGVYGKSNDTKEARQDQQSLKDPDDLYPEQFQGRASYALTKEEKVIFFECLSSMKEPPSPPHLANPIRIRALSAARRALFGRRRRYRSGCRRGYRSGCRRRYWSGEHDLPRFARAATPSCLHHALELSSAGGGARIWCPTDSPEVAAVGIHTQLQLVVIFIYAPSRGLNFSSEFIGFSCWRYLYVHHIGAATKLLDDMMINYSEWHTERAPQGKKVNSVEETSSLSDKIDVIMSMLVDGRSNVDPNNVPLASLVAQEENVDVNFIKNNNFNNNAYRNNSGNNYRPYPSANGNGYGNSYGNSYNNNRNVPSGLEAMLKEFISTQTAFNKSVEEKLDKIDTIASRVDRLASDVNLLKLKVMPNNDIDNKITTTANAIQVRINENIRLMADCVLGGIEKKMKN